MLVTFASALDKPVAEISTANAWFAHRVSGIRDNNKFCFGPDAMQFQADIIGQTTSASLNNHSSQVADAINVQQLLFRKNPLLTK